MEIRACLTSYSRYQSLNALLLTRVFAASTNMFSLTVGFVLAAIKQLVRK